MIFLIGSLVLVYLFGPSTQVVYMIGSYFLFALMSSLTVRIKSEQALLTLGEIPRVKLPQLI